MRFRFATCALCTALLTSCGTRSAAGGNSTEADNALQGTVVDSSGRPRPGAIVVAMPSLGVDDRTLVSTTTDASGAWSLTVGSGGAAVWRVEIRDGGRGISSEMRAGSSLPGAVPLPLGSLSGMVRSDRTVPVVVALRGTPRRLSPDPDGKWRFDSLPAGAAARVCAFADADTVDLVPVHLLPGGTVWAPNPLQLTSRWAAESLQVASVLARLGADPGRVLRRTLFDSLGAPDGLALDSLALDSLPADLAFPSWTRRLDLSENHLTNIPAPLRNLPYLWWLDYSGNRWQDTARLTGLTALTWLSLSRTGLRLFPNLSGPNALAHLEIDGDSLTTLSSSAWSQGSLVFLSARNNRIDSLQPVLTTSNLRTLRLGGNRIRGLPTTWRNLENLETVGLESNPLAALNDSLGTGWRKLRALYLDSANLATLPTTLTSFAPGNFTLSLRGNSLCGDLGSRMTQWLDSVYQTDWKKSQPQICP